VTKPRMREVVANDFRSYYFAIEHSLKMAFSAYFDQSLYSIGLYGPGSSF